MAYEYILTETHGAVGLVRLNRPKARNALCLARIRELARAVDGFETDTSVGALVITSDERAFAAGADIGEMLHLGGFNEVFLEDFNGGGCELAMMCDLILAAETARFGQLEITVGILPGGGGTQRLTRLIGKSKAMEMCLTGRIMDAAEAASQSRPVAMMIKECVNRAYETSLAEGLLFERRALHAAFS